MKKITEEYIKRLDDLKIKYSIPTEEYEADKKDEDKVILRCVSTQNQAFGILLLIADTDVAIRTSYIAGVNEEKTSQILELCNKLNSKYRWVKFTMDSEGRMVAQIDAKYSENDAADICVNLTICMIRIVDEAFSEILHIIWA